MDKTADDEFLTHAAVTRSMLGWGVIVGPIYLAVGLTQALTRDGFDLGVHPLSLLMLGAGGWIQQVNLIAAGVMVLIAAWGVHRVVAGERVGRTATLLIAVFGLAAIGGGVFAPDPVLGFPPGSEGGRSSASGIIHLILGAIQFGALAAACFVGAHWVDRRGLVTHRRLSTASGFVILGGFIGGAALSQMTVGVVLLWVAVVTGFAWLALSARLLWTLTPHPDPDRRRSGG